MFSSRPPRKPVPSSSIRASSSSNHQIDDVHRTDNHHSSRPLDNRPSQFSSNRSDDWPFSAATLIDGFAVDPSRSSRAVASAPTRPSHRYSTPGRVNFSFEVPEDPLRAAIGLESVLERPLSRPEEPDGENMIAYSLLDFSRCQVGSIKPHTSALSAMVTSRHLPNPFAAVAPITGGPLNIKIYFPRAEQPSGQLLELALPRKATIEDAIALALWTYWERHWLPELNVSRPRDIDVTSWIMLVPGKDGVVNKRIAQSKMANFNFDKYAIVRSPRNLSEKRRIEKQVAKFKLLSPPVTLDNPRHIRQHSLPILKSGSKGLDAPISLSKLP